MYKTVKISDVKPEQKGAKKRLDNRPFTIDDSYWINKIRDYGSQESANQYRIQYQISNSNFTDYSMNPVLHSFMWAYNNHEDVILSPDDLWLMILIYFSKYVNDNAEQLRSLFVDHQGKKKLIVTEPMGKREEDWTDFFEMMKEKISENVKNEDIIDQLTSNFSTTTEIESILSYACIMDTFQAYFSYGRCIPGCGIRAVHFEGTLDDWHLLKNKTEQLKMYTKKCDKYEQYLDNLLPILDEFIKTYQGQVNSIFWDHIMDLNNGRLGSGRTTYLTGWILKLFYGVDINSKNIDFDAIKLNNIKVPVEVENHCTGKKKTCYVIGGFHGVYSEDHKHKPVMSLAVIEDLSTIKSLGSA
ncbi:unnamed protein product [Didymodactylos carnosus]|uniref:Uncharacterized protein n=1 Tax=Didymodactylos carnosus TaxID=1234261 RepID=A0A814UJU8_9BILA|nr:unnamed protein product [Didymodactylos carnosus]CAF1178073.1 unnamed protein product [Didymodactylos carnosus]CAF3673447.1 unnamed protein product [Didymodactylos carnosus]CAF3942220.1 unnamed protein product [Didymodactylos carnosus]